MDELRSEISVIKRDTIFMCETWTNDQHSAAFLMIDGFSNVFRQDRVDTQNGIGGGLLVYAREDISVAQDESVIFSQFTQCCAIKLPLVNSL